LHRWHRWEEIIGLAHLVVTHRPGWTLDANAPDLDSALATLWQEAHAETLGELELIPAGRILEFDISPLNISSTQIRAIVAKGESPRFLVPEAVWNLIRLQGLYGIKRNVDED